MGKAEKICQGMIRYGLLLLFLLIMLFLNYYGLRYTMNVIVIPYGHLLTEWQDNLWLHGAVAAGFLLLAVILRRRCKKAKSMGRYVAAFQYAAMFLALLLCLAWVVQGQFWAQSDCGWVLEAMADFRGGSTLRCSRPVMLERTGSTSA